MITIKRIYAPPDPSDGTRVLVDRLWPRGIAKEAAAIDLWAKAIAPSNELRKWFAHDDARWDEFERRYRTELAAPELAETLADLRERGRAGTLTLLYATRNEPDNNASALRDFLLEIQRR